MENQTTSDVAATLPQMNEEHDEAVHKHKANLDVRHVLLVKGTGYVNLEKQLLSATM